MQYKIPGLRNQMTERIDAYGNTASGGLPDTDNVLYNIGGALFNAVTPTYPSKIKTTAVDKEMRRLYQSGIDMDNITVFASDAPKYFEVNGKTVHLTGEQYEKYAKNRNRSIQSMRDNVLKDSQYKRLTDEAKAKAMDYAYQYANALAKAGAGVGYKIKEGWMKDLAGASPEQLTGMFIQKAVESQLGTGSQRYDDISKMVSRNTIDDATALALLTDSQYKGYTEYCEAAKVPVTSYLQVLGQKSKDGAKQSDVKIAIAQVTQDNVQRRAIWCTLYAESTIPTEWYMK